VHSSDWIAQLRLRLKAAWRGRQTFPWLESLWRDSVYGLRILARDRAFASVAVLSLALAIGANTAIFTLVNAALLEKLPVPEPERLVVANWSAAGGRMSISMTNARSAKDPKTGLELCNVFTYGAFERFRTQARQFSQIFAFTSLNRAALRIGGRTDLVKGMLVSGGYYKGLAIRPLAGRLLSEADDRADAEPVAVISYQLWRDRFREDPRAVGSKATVNGVPVTIAGVTRPEFYGVSPGGFVPSPDITLTLAMTPLVDPRLAGGSRSVFLEPKLWWVNVMGRLRPVVDARSAEAELNALFRQSIDAAELHGKPPLLHLLPGDQGLDSVRSGYSEPLWTLWVVAGLVLLIACANVATLLVARGAARRGEVTVRLAMGAARARICRQLITEGLLLSIAAGVIGLLISIWGSRALLGWATSSTDTLRLPLGMGPRVLGFATALSVVVGILFSLAPALRASRVNLVSALKEGAGGARGSAHGGRSGWLGQGLIVLQVALSLLLIVGAGLFLRTLDNLRSVELGLRTDGVLLFGLDPTLNKYSDDRLRGLYRDLLARLNRTPGVLSATASSMRLLTGGMSGGPLRVPGATGPPRDGIQAHVNCVAPRFFETMAIPVILGRGPTERDAANSPRVAFLSQAMAKRAFPDGSPLGRTITLLGKTEYVVAGVVADAHYSQVKGEPPLTAYVPYEQPPWGRLGSLHFAVRTSGRPEAFAGTVRSLVRGLDPNLPLIDIQTQKAVVDNALRRERLFANLSTAFGGIALLLACIGIYGVVAYSAARRTAEIGIRVAMGARYGNIVGLVLRRTMILVALGAVVGIACALAVTKFIGAMLFNVTPRDPRTFAAAAALLILTALVAGFLPARRAARVDPMTALRSE
jgi:predicted permease